MFFMSRTIKSIKSRLEGESLYFFFQKYSSQNSTCFLFNVSLCCSFKLKLPGLEICSKVSILILDLFVFFSSYKPHVCKSFLINGQYIFRWFYCNNMILVWPISSGTVDRLLHSLWPENPFPTLQVACHRAHLCSQQNPHCWWSLLYHWWVNSLNSFKQRLSC